MKRVKPDVVRLRPRLPRILALVLLGTVCCVSAPSLAQQTGTGPSAENEAAAGCVEMDPLISAIDIELSFDPETGHILEQASLKVTATDAADLTFDINEWLIVERSSVSEGIIEHRKAGDRLEVLLDPPLSGTRTLRFKISGRPRRIAEYLVSQGAVILGRYDRWYPMLSNTWAMAQVTVRTPPGWTAVAPGSRMSGSDPSSWRWRSERPVRTLAVVAAPDLVLTEGRALRMPVRLAAAKSWKKKDADAVSQILSGPVTWFSSGLMPYPFDGFNLVVLPGLSHRVRASGMLVIPAGTPLDRPADAADLLSSQWFGERLAGDGVWMEAFAAWYAAVYSRERNLTAPAEIARLRREYFTMPRERDVALSHADLRTPEAVLRGKGSAAPDMIRIAVGDRRFYRAIKELFQEPVRPPLSLREVRAVFEKHAGSTLLRAFADWFDRSGAPEFRAALRTEPADGDRWRTELTLQQLRGIYALPVEVVFVGPGGPHREVIQVDGETTSVSYVLPFRAVRVEVDPLAKLFQWNSE